jgi:DNA-binding XRE family transcriptional regulator
MTEGQVIFDDEYELTQSDVVYTKKQRTKINNKKGLVNPYTMDRPKVRPYHFRDARLYDPDINEAGWRIPSHRARRKYQKWLSSVRQNSGWENFRRRFCSILDEEERVDNEGNIYTIFVRKQIPLNNLTDDEVWKRYNGDVIVRKIPEASKHWVKMDQHKNINQNKNSKPLPQSRDKGVKITDDEFRPKMFTEKMGKDIAQIRNNLGLTQSDLGKKINVDSNTIKNIEIGGVVTFNAEDSMVRTLAKVLGLSTIKYQE